MCLIPGQYGLLPPPAGCILGSCSSLRWTGGRLCFLSFSGLQEGVFCLRVEEIVLTSMLEEALPDSGFYSCFPFTVHSLLSSLTAPPHTPSRGWVSLLCLSLGGLPPLSGTGAGASAAVSVWFRAQGMRHGDPAAVRPAGLSGQPTGGGGRGSPFHQAQLFRLREGRGRLRAVAGMVELQPGM